eukprot:TRINITY_DN8147_c0_g2_i1.p1 TRINITY_DN8147_c0_g2~~TRINITY_DN8147_c0_g2_i1.p1  ORF type:complete len:1190 (+),score=229.25 TRINITY_DN8147_c0_g2_i1:170-3739(+)
MSMDLDLPCDIRRPEARRSTSLRSLDMRERAESGSELASPTSQGRVRIHSDVKLSTQVSFHVIEKGTQPGDEVRAVGSHPALGSWDPLHGHRLVTDERIFPCWVSAEPVTIESASKVEYKYVITSSEGAVRSWEGREDNRSFTASGEELVLEDDNGLHRYKTGVLEDPSEEPFSPNYTCMDSPAAIDADTRLAYVRHLDPPDYTFEEHFSVYMVSLRLPVRVKRVVEGKNVKFEVDDTPPTDGRNFAFLPLMQELKKKMNRKVVCVGWPGINVSDKEKPALERVLKRYDCIPVFPPQVEFERFVHFCATFIWPVFHDVMHAFQTSNPRLFDESGWAAYQQINNFFANAVLPYTHESDIVWIHDYHLMMTPTFISKKFRLANIGFFLHTPWPSSDSFKSLPVREELLSGLLCADQIGFQFFPYARNFLVALKRIRGLDPTFRAGGFITVEYGGRDIMVKIAHFVYPYKQTLELLEDPRIAEKTAEVRKLFEGKTVFACMDREDGLSGLLPKFRAFKKFLAAFPEHQGKVVLVQYCSQYSDGSYEGSCNLLNPQTLRDQADAFIVEKEDGSLAIEQKEGHTPEVFLRLNVLSRLDRLALFRAANVLLDTSVKAGLNLMPFEFIAAHNDDTENHAVSIVSTFSGCSRVLRGANKVNPWNTGELVSACDRALKLSPAEKEDSWHQNIIYAAGACPMDWFEGFMMDLRRARKTESMLIQTIGFGAKIRHVCVDQSFSKLPFDEVVKAYKMSRNRVIFLDNEGTLAADKRKIFRNYGAPEGDVDTLKSRGSPPSPQILDCLQALCADPSNTVVILSGRNREMMEDWFGPIDNLGLAAERGFYYKLPVVTGQHWHCMVQEPDNTWKSYAFEIMRQFVKRTQGSFIENKGSALVWQYRAADQHFGSWQAKELSCHLKELLFGFDVDVNEGKGYVEVKLRGIDKGRAAQKVLHKVGSVFGDADFILCIGDDRSDEDMFEAINLLIEESEANDACSQLSTTDPDDSPESPRNQEPPKIGSGGTPSQDSLAGGSGSWGGSMTGLGLSLKRFSSGSGSKEGLSGSLSHALSGSMSGGLGGGLGRRNLRSASFTRGAPQGGSSFRDLAGLVGCGTIDEGGGIRPGRPRFYTCTVGQKPSAAKFYVDDVDEVSELLQCMREIAERRPSRNAALDANSRTWSGPYHSLVRGGKAPKANGRMPSF